MGAGLGSLIVLERNGKLAFAGYLANSLMVLTCLFALVYPFFEIMGLSDLECPFRMITGLPCPGCGYTRSVWSLVSGAFLPSFHHNPGWPFLILFLGKMTWIGSRSLLSGRQIVLGRLWVILIIVLIAATWTGKFLLGSTYY